MNWSWEDIIRKIAQPAAVEEVETDCTGCGDSHPADEMTEIGGDHWCSRCAEKELTVCGECDDPIIYESAIWVGKHKDMPFCAECAKEAYPECAGCSKRHSKDDMREADDRMWCEDCLYENFEHCDKCEKWVESGDSHYIQSAEISLCDDCFGSDYTHCESCNDPVANMDARTGPNDREYCEDCFSESFSMCDNCHESVDTDDIITTDDGAYCKDCAPVEPHLHTDEPFEEYEWIEFGRDVVNPDSPVADRLTLLRQIVVREDLPLFKIRPTVRAIKDRFPDLIRSISRDVDINKLCMGNKFSADRIDEFMEKHEHPVGGLKVSIGGWDGDQILFEDHRNIVFRLDIGSVITDMYKAGKDAGAKILTEAVSAALHEHPAMPGVSIGWARVLPVDDGKVWFVEEMQSDFDNQYRKAIDSAKKNGAGFGLPPDQLRQGLEDAGAVLDRWHEYLLGKIHSIARENGVPYVAVISKKQLDEWQKVKCKQCGWAGSQKKLVDVANSRSGKGCPSCSNSADIEWPTIAVGKTRSNTKKKRYYQDAPKSLGYQLQEVEWEDLPQVVWMRKASKDKDISKRVAFTLSIGLYGSAMPRSAKFFLADLLPHTTSMPE